MAKILKPASEEEAAIIVKEAVKTASTIEILGTGTKRPIGNQMPCDQVLSSSTLSGIVHYEAAELVMVAKAGTPMSEIDKALKTNKQMLAFEPANWSKMLGTKGKQSIGGIAATNMSGPRRFVAGAARDSLLGVRFVNGSGEIIKNGGQVMKNVTGLDLVKLMGGSWGTLGLLTEVSFKVLPCSETEITLAIESASAAEAAVMMARAMSTSTDVSGASFVPVDLAAPLMGKPMKAGLVFLRLEGLKETIPVRRDRLLRALGNAVKVQELNAKTSKAIWANLRDVTPFVDGAQSPVWRVSVAPMAGSKVTEEILSQTDGQAYYDWQGGLVWLRLDDEYDANAALVRSAIAKHGGGHATLIRANDEVRAATPVFQPENPVIAALSERVKASMDPTGIFNPGRMVFSQNNKAG